MPINLHKCLHSLKFLICIAFVNLKKNLNAVLSMFCYGKRKRNISTFSDGSQLEVVIVVGNILCPF